LARVDEFVLFIFLEVAAYLVGEWGVSSQVLGRLLIFHQVAPVFFDEAGLVGKLVDIQRGLYPCHAGGCVLLRSIELVGGFYF
jgi:hypothetical protein